MNLGISEEENERRWISLEITQQNLYQAGFNSYIEYPEDGDKYITLVIRKRR